MCVLLQRHGCAAIAGIQLQANWEKRRGGTTSESSIPYVSVAVYTAIRIGEVV